jgi:hypothetical protein
MVQGTGLAVKVVCPQMYVVGRILHMAGVESADVEDFEACSKIPMLVF